MTLDEHPVEHNIESGQVYRKETGRMGKVFELEIEDIYVSKDLKNHEPRTRLNVFERTPDGATGRSITLSKFAEYIDTGFELTWERDDQ